MKPRNVIILNEAKGNVALYHIRVEVSGVPLWTGVYAESVERANRIAEKVYGKGSVRGRPTKVKESVEEAKGPKSVKRGSQKRYKHPMGTDKPEKYMGATTDVEQYTDPQGIGSKAANVTMKPPANEEVLPDVKTYSPKEIAAHHGVDLESILRELRMGIQVEMEHTQNEALSKEIALDHLLELPDYYTRLERMERVKEGSLGPEFSRGLTNSSTGRGAVPPPTDFDPKELPNPLRPVKRHSGSKAPVKKAMRDAAKQNTDKVRRPNSPVTEDRLDELFGQGSTLPYQYNPRSVTWIDIGDGIRVAVAFQSMRLGPEQKAGYNVGFATVTPEGSHDGLRPVNLGIDRQRLFALFNTIIEIVQKGVEDLRADRVFFVAVEPMKNIYPRLLKKFVTDEWNLTKYDNQRIMGYNLDVYMVERKGSEGYEMDTGPSFPSESREPMKEIIGPRGNKYPYDYRGTDAWSEIDLGDGIEVAVGFMDINSLIPNMEPGYNVGFITYKDGQTHYGIDRADLGLGASETIALFNTIIEILQRLERDAKPNVVYFIAVEPMKNIYPRLLRKFADPNVWKTEKGRYHVPMVGGQLDVYKLTRRGYMDEMVRLPIQTKFNADYEIKDGEKTVGVATVNDGVIEKLMINQDAAEEDFKGHALSTTLGTIVRDADLQNANLAMQIVDLEDQEMKRFLERFGFRHTGEGIFKRTAGSIAPPSVIEEK